MKYQVCNKAPSLWDAFEVGNRAEFDRLKEGSLVETTGAERSYAKQ